MKGSSLRSHSRSSRCLTELQQGGKVKDGRGCREGAIVLQVVDVLADHVHVVCCCFSDGEMRLGVSQGEEHDPVLHVEIVRGLLTLVVMMRLLVSP